MKILQAKNLTKRFGGVYAVENLSLSVEKGTITAVIGPNGSGKTTLVNLLSGILPADEGMIIVQDSVIGAEVPSYSPILKNRRIRRNMCNLRPYDIAAYGVTRTFQEVRLFNQMTVLDNVLVVLTERHVFGALFETHKDFHLKKAEEVLKRADLWEKRSALASQLSYGQRKLLEIARALVMQAEIYLFDEPFAGLFPEMLKVVVSILQKLRREGKTIVLIEHNMELIRELADHIFVMDSGKLLVEGRPNDVLRKGEVIEAYLGE